jgi:hypothetical protein
MYPEGMSAPFAIAVIAPMLLAGKLTINGSKHPFPDRDRRPRSRCHRAPHHQLISAPRPRKRSDPRVANEATTSRKGATR